MTSNYFFSVFHNKNGLVSKNTFTNFFNLKIFFALNVILWNYFVTEESN